MPALAYMPRTLLSMEEALGSQTFMARLPRSLAIRYAPLISQINPIVSGFTHSLVPSHSGLDK